MRRLIPFVIALALLAGTPVSASADGGGANNVVVVTTTKEGSTDEKSKLKISHVGGPTVGSTNAAGAVSYECTGCRTVAIAFQAVLVTGDPHTVTPVNTAIALNIDCTACTAYAFAYQYVLSTHGPVHLSQEGHEEIHHQSERIRALGESDLPPAALTAELNEVKAQFKATIDEELIATGQAAQVEEMSQVEAAPAPETG